jgi:amidase
MKFSEYIRCDATALSEHVASGAVSPEELLKCALEQSVRANPKTNAICTSMESQARKQLTEPPKGPFAGVPFLIKDAVQDYAGLPTSYGSKSMLRLTPQQHSAVVQRYLNAGLIIFGKTNLPEFALKSVTDSKLFGVASNPWGLDRTPGGSSGGAAAAVASGVVPMAAGNDGGGSIRIPASYCGLFGLRPSRGRVSSGPGLGEVWCGASSEGVISRSVRDSARALDVLQGSEPGDPFDIARPEQPYAQTMQRDVSKLRIGFSTTSPIGTAVDPQAVAAVKDAAQLLQSLGHDVQEQTPSVDGTALSISYLHMYFGYVSATVRKARALGAKSDEFELLTRLLATLGNTTASGVFVEQLGAWNNYARALGTFHGQFDMLLTPTTATSAPTHGTGNLPKAQEWVLSALDSMGLLRILAGFGLLDGMVNQIARDSLAIVPFTQLANLTGTPAMSVPLYWTPDGLPMGVQFAARFGKEDQLLQLARQLEEARPWMQSLPGWVTNGD